MDVLDKRPISTVDHADIQALVDDAVEESHVLDYKQEAPADSRSPDKNKQDFLVDACAFANAGGGAVVYGIREQRDANGQPTGVPEAAIGLRSLNVDVTVRQLRALLDAHVDPRIPTVEFHAVEGFQDGPVLIMRVGRSWRGPHRMSMSDRSFPVRRDRGNGYFNTTELRAAISVGDSVAEKLRAFRDERVSRIWTNDGPLLLLLDPQPRIVLHVVPLEALAGNNQRTGADIRALGQMIRSTDSVQAQTYERRRMNLDGLVAYMPAGDEIVLRYVQVFRWGALEHVDAYEIKPAPEQGPAKGHLLLDVEAIRRELLWSLDDSLKILRALRYIPPISVMVSLVGVRGYQLSRNLGMIRRGVAHAPIDRDLLLLPDRIVEDFSETPSTILAPALELISDAAGG